MVKGRRRSAALLGLVLGLSLLLQDGLTAQAANGDLRGGIAAVLNPGSSDTTDIINATAAVLNIELEADSDIQESTLVMANVQSALNVRCD